MLADFAIHVQKMRVQLALAGALVFATGWTVGVSKFSQVLMTSAGGKFETASMDEFSYGVANRGASIRIPNDAKTNGKGYFEDRRPSSNCDPYVVTSMMVQTCCKIDGPKWV